MCGATQQNSNSGRHVTLCITYNTCAIPTLIIIITVQRVGPVIYCSNTTSTATHHKHQTYGYPTCSYQLTINTRLMVTLMSDSLARSRATTTDSELLTVLTSNAARDDREKNVYLTNNTVVVITMFSVQESTILY